jgi:fructose-1,6-bisphosphatase/inositol monophosphatase family enzyme
MEKNDHLRCFREAAAAAKNAVSSLDDVTKRGTRPGQYALDLAADDAACEVLLKNGYSVLSEESGNHGEGPLVIIDPIDGSTNCSRGIPWFATSLCLVDEVGPETGLVVNQASGVTYSAVRNNGAYLDGKRVTVRKDTAIDDAIVAVTGLPTPTMPWWQFRAFGAAALDLCLVASGVLDAFCVVSNSHLFEWDYAASLLICLEAGAVAVERDGLELISKTTAPRRPIVASNQKLLEGIVKAFV